MGKMIVKVWMTLDGIFDASSMGKWSNPFHSDARAAEITENILQSDAMIYGRKTYEMLAPYWSTLKNNEMGIADKLNSVPKYVVSSTLNKADWNNSSIINGNVAGELAKLKQQYAKQILIDGSATLVRSLLDTDLIDEYRFLVHPVIMGSGKRFFEDGLPFSKLNLIKSVSLDLGVMLLHYQTIKS